MGKVRAQESIGANLIIADAEIVGCRSRIPSNTHPLGVIENIEGFRTELERHALLDCKVLQKRHIEVRAMRIGEDVAAGIPKR